MNGQRGMTLVEVVVASVILSLVMLATVTALRTFGNTYDKVGRQIASIDRMREVSQFLRQSLGNAVAEAGRFDGDDSEVIWMAPLDRAGSAAGLQHMRLSLKASQLILSFAPYDPAATSGSEPAWASVVPDFPLLEDVTSFVVSYKVTPTGGWQPQPQTAATNGEVLTTAPWEIGLAISAAGRQWPPIMIHLDAVGVTP